MKKLDKFEKDINNSYENNEWKSVKNVSQRISKYQSIAKIHLRKKKEIIFVFL